VEWDDKSVWVRVLDQLPSFWNQDFLWRDITRVCFKDEGVSSSDILFLEVRDRGTVAAFWVESQFLTPRHSGSQGGRYNHNLHLAGTERHTIGFSHFLPTLSRYFCGRAPFSKKISRVSLYSWIVSR
jgi:hypothetical protein